MLVHAGPKWALVPKIWSFDPGTIKYGGSVNGCTRNQRIEISKHKCILTLFRNKCSIYDSA